MNVNSIICQHGSAGVQNEMIVDYFAGGGGTGAREHGGKRGGASGMSTSRESFEALVDQLRYRPVATTAAQMREAADAIERLIAERDALREERNALRDALETYGCHLPDFPCNQPTGETHPDGVVFIHDCWCGLERVLEKYPLEKTP